jgi:hypothetical protein
VQEDLKWLQDRLVAGGGDWDTTRYNARYHARADGRSWDAMKVRDTA